MGDNNLSALLTKAKDQSPFPWQRIAHANGLLQIVDAKGKEVPILLMTDLVCAVTAFSATR